ncbi:MAG: hypothetical protein AAF604_19105 [Acidobacteriota bacterium]
MPLYSSWLDPRLISDEMLGFFWPTLVASLVWSLLVARPGRRRSTGPGLWLLPWWIWALQANHYLRWWALGHSSFERVADFFAAAVLHATVIAVSVLIPTFGALPGLWRAARHPSRLHLMATLVLVAGTLLENALILVQRVHLALGQWS